MAVFSSARLYELSPIRWDCSDVGQVPVLNDPSEWRLNNKSADIRQQAADLIARIAAVMKVGPQVICSATSWEAIQLT